MNSPKFRFLVIFLLVAVFNYFFWEEKPGINLLLFNSLLILSLVYFSNKRFDTLALKISLSLTIVTGIMLIVYNSFISFFAHFVSFIILVGLLHRTQLSTVSGALWQYGLNALMTTFEQFILLGESISYFTDKNKYLKQTHRIATILIIPIVVFSIFVVIFKFANPIFGEILDSSFASFFWAIEAFFQNFSFPHLFFLAIGTFFIISVLYNWDRTNVLHRLSSKADTIRTPEKIDVIKLETEYKTALILICSVNVLLLIINAIDVRYLWFNINNDLKSAHELSKLVHEGTYLLILSILLSIAILLYYFRKDLNFFDGKRWLVISAYVWIIQNGILVISVLLRNYEYITNYGLTHKRIGVAVFLLLTSIGLVMIWLKIKNLYSFFNLFRQAGWAGYFVLASLAIFDWDSMIARYNLSTQNATNLDYRYLYELSPRTLPILYENKEKIVERIKQVYSDENDRMGQINILNKRIGRYLAEQRSYTWVSWDLSNSKAVEYFNNKKLEEPTATMQP
ncbi:DUF4173 domain-containing protein [Emticicia sp. BO119]|uniref:DUF4153 domain-containing protein n=1 Tax=Emticicia sp. BO119 TaxID=2757768 RepID=UPI0015F0C351|nr:DUF4173 domain-containing protein [Emticicia sp. BO119]MBA4853118.1 DUF4173 domain-containing protein [Emticicia sp. BO119]